MSDIVSDARTGHTVSTVTMAVTGMVPWVTTGHWITGPKVGDRVKVTRTLMGWDATHIGTGSARSNVDTVDVAQFVMAMVHSDSLVMPEPGPDMTGVSVVLDESETGSGVFDIVDNGTHVGYVYSFSGMWHAISTVRNANAGRDHGTRANAVNALLLSHRTV